MNNSLFPSYNNISEENKLDQTSYKPIFTNIDYEVETIMNKINDIDNLDEVQIKNILYRQHSIILNYDLFLSNNKSRASAQKLFSNKKFLEILLSQIGVISLSNDEVMCVNKLAYDYYILPNKDSYVSDLLLQIAFNINNIDVIRLSSKLGVSGAKILSMINKSTFQMEKRVHRINTFLVKYDLSLSAQDMVDIMCMLYDRFTYPIIYTLLESAPDNLTAEEKIRFDNISSAILSIILSLTSNNMKKVLSDYAFIVSRVKSGTKFRFSLKSVPDERLQSIIYNIEHDTFENLLIP